MTQKLKKIYQFTFFTILLLFFVVGTAIPTYAQNYSKDYSNCILKEYGKFVYYLDPTDNTISITRGYKGILTMYCSDCLINSPGLSL